MCNFSCTSDECRDCSKLKFEIVAREVKCDGKCSECSCKNCGE